MTQSLLTDYDQAYDRLLTGLSTAQDVQPDLLTLFWPMRGAAYSGALMIVGKAVNGWIDEISVNQLPDSIERERAIAAASRTGHGYDGACPMRWVTDAWGRGGGEYSTARSAYWRHARGVLAAVDPGSSDDPLWSSRLVWSNLAKVAPAIGGNPGGPLLEVQRALAPDLLKLEIETFQPRRILISTGRAWFEPFARILGLDVDWRQGLVEGVANDGRSRWVIAKHPQGKPRSILDDVVSAFNEGDVS